jgi:hypothetical protein
MEKNTSSSFNNSIEIEDQNNVGSGQWWEFFEGNFYAQGFTPSQTPLTKVQLRIYSRPNNPENTNCTVSIRETLDGDDIVSNTVYLDDITTFPYVDFVFPDTDLTIDSKYYIICIVDNGYLYSDCYGLRYSYNDQYDRGDAWYSENGISWYPAEDYTLEQFPGVDLSFTTYFRDYAPDNCEIDGPIEGKAKKNTEYNFCTNDPEGHEIRYYIEWGDGMELKWIGPYESGEICTREHSWSSKDNYTIRVKAKDVYGAETDWTELEINMPKVKTLNSLLLTFLKNHPNIFPLIQQLLKLK